MLKLLWLLAAAAAPTTAAASKSMLAAGSRRLRTSSSSQIRAALEEMDAAVGWARENPEVARAALAPPPMVTGANTPILESTVEAYAARRGFAVPESEPGRTHSLRLLSHALTYPLTLSAFARAAGLVASRETLSAAVLGARAESALPSGIWAELESSGSKWDVLLLGPEATPTRRFNGETVRGVRLVGRRQSVSADDDLGAVFADAFKTDDDNTIDLVALFNPGLGHAKLEAGWAGGLAAVAQAGPGCALLVTSFSDRDQRSDLDGLQRLSRALGLADPKVLVPPTLNPFRSRKPCLDPLDPTHLTYANQRAFVVRFCTENDGQ